MPNEDHEAIAALYTSRRPFLWMSGSGDAPRRICDQCEALHTARIVVRVLWLN
jgi:hypothetical protein